MKYKIVWLGCLLATCLAAVSQNLSNRGKDFWVGYGHHQFMEDGSNTQEMVLYFSAEQAATVTVTIDSSTWTKTYIIPANTVIASDNIPKAGAVDARLYDLPRAFGGTGGEGIYRKKGIHITSNVPIVAYAHIFGSASSGATMLMPVETWGYSYISINSNQSYASNCFSWVYVMAQHDSTMIQVTAPVASRYGIPANSTYTLMLMKGQIYQTMAGPEAASTKNEMTGTKVNSIANANGKCYPIAVFAGSSRTTNVYGVCPGGGGDNDNQQCFPSQAWGKRYLTAPTSSSNIATTYMTNTFKIAVRDPSTIVKRNGVALTTLINNSYYIFQSSTPNFIESDKPIMVAQFMTGGCLAGGLGDPEMMYISPIEQGIKRIGFYRNTQQAITVNYLTLIIPTAGIGSLVIDGSNVFSATYVHPNLAGYSVVIKRYNAAQTQSTASSDSAFTAITYGLGSVESYGYNAGTLINNLNAVGIIKNEFNNTSTANPYTCKLSPVELALYIPYKPTNLLWQLSLLGASITPNADVNQPNPTLVDSTQLNGIWYYKYKLPTNYQFTDTGTFAIKLRSTNPAIEGCDHSEELSFQVVVKVKPSPNFTYTPINACRLDTTYFTASDTVAGYSLNRWRWDFGTNDTAITRNVSKVFATGGVKTVTLKVISAEGCVSDSTVQFTVYDPPSSGFTSLPASICAGSSITFSDTSHFGPGSAPVFSGFYWDFGNGQTSIATTTQQTVTYPTYGTYIVKHVAKQSNLCPGDTAFKTIKVYAIPKPGFVYPAGCLPLSGLAQFTDTTVNPDGQALTYIWHFGDANATASNPDTSILQNPSHIYTAFGSYNIKLLVKTANGCYDSITVPATFALRPTLAYTPITSVCVNAAPFSVANASITNAVPGKGIYKGPGTDTLGVFNPAIAGPGIKTIWYVFTSTGGCTDSVSQTIRVQPKPSAAFTMTDTAFCLSATPTITPNSTISAGTIKDWVWDFGNGTATYTNNNPFVHGYTTAGTNIIKLYNVSDSGCISDTITKQVKANAMPLASFNFTHTGCKLDSVYFTAAGSAGNYTISKWKWNFLPGTDTSILQNPTVVLPIGLNSIQLTVTTPDGCTDDSVRSITVFAPPVAGLTGSPLSTCEPGTVNFTDASSYGAAGVPYSSSYWDFGNSQTVTNTTNAGVSNAYPVYGTYIVKHVVKVSALCISDTALQTIRVYAKPRVSFTYPIGCLPVTNVAQFTNTTTVPDGQTLTYTWDFGDPGPTNSSTLQNPTHVYTSYGPFLIKLSVTTPNGCVKDTSVSVTFNVRPALAFAPLTSICVSGTPVSVAKGSVTNGVPGAGVYRGPGTDAAGLFDPATAGVGIKTIWYIFTSDAGCKDSVSTTIKVHPKPTVDFTLSSTSFCMDASTVITPQATITSGTVAAYNWSFGDQTTANNLTNASVIKLYPAYGTYDVKFIAISDSGCISDAVTKSLTVNPLPLADFTLPLSVCMPAGRAAFSNLSTVPNNGSMTYVWNFGDATAPDVQKDPTHIYAATGPYTINLIATSAAGCKDTATQILSAFYAQPTAMFDVTPQILCQGTPNVFTDRSVAPGSKISGWSWMFGDGGVSSLSAPFKVYGVPGDYNIKLVVRSPQGCLSDTFTKTVKVYLQPVIDAGPSFLVPQGELITFKPSVNDSVNLRFTWTPFLSLTSPTVLRPSLNAMVNQIYYLTAVGDGNCTATDSLRVTVMRPLKIPNVFSPNGDGINERWEITNLTDYPSANVKVFDRYGALVFESAGYNRPWDGTFNGKALPVGVYYYIIDPRNGFKAFSGSITILK